MKPHSFFILLLLVPLTMSGNMKQINSRTVHRQFEVAQGAKLIINNQFGKVECLYWDKSEVDILITISLEDKSAANAESLMQKIDFILEGSPDEVKAKTILGKGFRNKDSFSIDYLVRMPAWINLDLSNTFGDVSVDSLAGRSRIHLEYGHGIINHLNHGDNLLEVEFGSLGVNHLKGAVAASEFSKINLGYAGSLRLTGEYSQIRIDKVIVMEGQLEGGTLSVVQGSVMNLKSTYTSINIGALDKKLTIDGEFGNCEVKSVSPAFERIAITNSYGSYSLPVPVDPGYRIDAETQFGGIQLPDKDFVFSYRQTGDTRQVFKGSIGSNPAGEVYIRSEFGNISLKYKP